MIHGGSAAILTPFQVAVLFGDVRIYSFKVKGEDPVKKRGGASKKHSLRDAGNEIVGEELGYMEPKMWPQLRSATNNDLPGIRDVVFGVLQEYGLLPDPGATDADLQDLNESYFNNGGLFFVLVEENDRIIGSYGLYRLDEDTCELRKMYLLPSYRGKGLGKRMLNDALNKARELGITKILLETASVLKEAIQLYKSYGFKEYKPEHLSCRCDQAFMLELM